MKPFILYAEDDADMATYTMEALRANGYEVAWAADGCEALDLYRAHAPDLVLLDIGMPGLNGYEVARAIRKTDQITPILYLTSFSDTASIIKGLDTGADEYICKDGLQMEVLVAKIKNAIRRHPVREGPVIRITPDTHLDTITNEITCCGEVTKISFRVSRFLKLLVANKNHPQQKDQVVRTVWEGNYNGPEYLSQSISCLRKAMSDDKRIEIVSNRSDNITLVVSES